MVILKQHRIMKSFIPIQKAGPLINKVGRGGVQQRMERTCILAQKQSAQTRIVQVYLVRLLGVLPAERCGIYGEIIG